MNINPPKCEKCGRFVSIKKHYKTKNIYSYYEKKNK